MPLLIPRPYFAHLFYSSILHALVSMVLYSNIGFLAEGVGQSMPLKSRRSFLAICLVDEHGRLRDHTGPLAVTDAGRHRPCP